MKILVGKDVGNYSFNAATKEITFSGVDLGTVDLKDVYLITNVTRNIIIYNFAGQGLGGSMAANVLTLDYDTTAIPMQNTDELQILVEHTQTIPVSVESAALPADAATESTLALAQASLTAIEADADTTANNTTSLDTKEGVTGEAADVDGTRAAQLRYIGEVEELSRLLLVAIEQDTTSLDTKEGVTGEAADAAGTRAAQLREIAEKIEAARALLVTIDTDTGNIAASVDSIDTKEGVTGAAADVDGTRAAQLRYIGETIEAARALLVTIDVDTGNIATNTENLDNKTPDLGANTIANSRPVNIASDQIIPVRSNGENLATEDTLASVDGKMTTSNTNTGNTATNTGNLDTKMGEVQASPTSNTLLGRLKDIWDSITSTIATISAVVGQRVFIYDAAGNQITSFGGGGGETAPSGGTYSTDNEDFSADVVNATRTITLDRDSVGGITLSDKNFMNGKLKVKKAADNSVVIITLDNFIWTVATKTLDVTDCTGSFDFATGDIVSLSVEGPVRGYEQGQNHYLFQNVSPEHKQNYNTEVVGISNQAAGTYRVEAPWVDTRNGSFQLEAAGGVIVTILATNNPLADTSSDDSWVDVSDEIFGRSSFDDSSTPKDIFFLDTQIRAARFMLKYVLADSTNSLIVNVYRAN